MGLVIEPLRHVDFAAYRMPVDALEPVYSTFGTDDFLNKDFGVSAEDATNSGLAEFALDGGYLSTGVNLLHRRDLGRSLQLVVAAEYEKYSSNISDSPIARDDFEYGIEMSLLWKF